MSTTSSSYDRRGTRNSKEDDYSEYVVHPDQSVQSAINQQGSRNVGREPSVLGNSTKAFPVFSYDVRPRFFHTVSVIIKGKNKVCLMGTKMWINVTMLLYFVFGLEFWIIDFSWKGSKNVDAYWFSCKNFLWTSPFREHPSCKWSMICQTFNIWKLFSDSS